MSADKRRYRSKARPGLEYTVESFCFGYKEAAQGKPKKSRQSVCYGVNFVKVTINKGEAPEDMDSLRLPPTLGLRVVVAYVEKEGKRGEEVAGKEQLLSWANVSSLINQTAKQQYLVARHSLLNIEFREKSREILMNATELVRSTWNAFISSIK